MQVFAQVEVAPLVIRAQKFIYVDGSSAARGVFGVEQNGTLQIEVIGHSCHVGFSGQVYSTLFR